MVCPHSRRDTGESGMLLSKIALLTIRFTRFAGFFGIVMGSNASGDTSCGGMSLKNIFAVRLRQRRHRRNNCAHATQSKQAHQ